MAIDIYVLGSADEHYTGTPDWPAISAKCPNYAIRALASTIWTASGSYFWNYINDAITWFNGVGTGGKLSLRVEFGIACPSWLLSATGVTTVSDGGSGSIPVPWNDVYQDYVETFLNDLATEFGSTVDHVSLSPFTGDNDEFRLQGSGTDWTNAGYSIANLEAAFKSLTASVRTSFGANVPNYVSWTSTPMVFETGANNTTIKTDLWTWWQNRPDGNLTAIGSMQNGGSYMGVETYPYNVPQANQAVGDQGTHINTYVSNCSTAGFTFCEIYRADIPDLT